MYDMAAGMARQEALLEGLVERFESMERRLLGNGQPGELAKLEHRLDSFGTRVKALEKFRWWVSGVGATFAAVGTFVGMLIEMLTKRSK